MKAKDKVCDSCMGIMKKEYYYDGKRVCSDCYDNLIRKDLENVVYAKQTLTDAVKAIERKTGKDIRMSLDNVPEIYVERGFDIVTRVFGIKPYEDNRRGVVKRTVAPVEDVDFYETDWRMADDSEDTE